MRTTTVGVIGHIDHGKTSLVAALTGIDTDRHAEEKRRGISIDLGFASFNLDSHEFALIDAPGHQRYIGNMLAGVSHIDVGLLVVACDQGIQAQTLEHAAIIRSLGVDRLVVAISRIDLADAPTLRDLTEELRLFLADYGFNTLRLVPLSSVTGVGLDELKLQLRELASPSEPPLGPFFRMPIDRVFTVPGRGTVVAGAIWSGNIHVGDSLELAATRQPVRVRELEVHGRPVTASQAGQRTALNITGVSARELHRGDELVTPGSHRNSQRYLLEVTMFEDAPPLRCPATVLLHTATIATAARITGVERLERKDRAVVLVNTSAPLIATYGQLCLMRKPYPVGSFAGGRFLAAFPARSRSRRQQLELGAWLRSPDAIDRLAAWVNYHEEVDIEATCLNLELGLSEDELRQSIAAGIEQSRFLAPRPGTLVARHTMDRLRLSLLKIMEERSARNENAWVVEQALVDQMGARLSGAVIQTLIDQLVADQQLVRVNNLLAIASERTLLSKKQQATLRQLLAALRNCRQPATIAEIAQQLHVNAASLESLARFAAAQGQLVEFRRGWFVAADVLAALCRELRDLFEGKAELSVAEIKDGWKLTRKHAVPLLEYCDKMDFTVRQQDQRTAGRALATLSMELTFEAR